MKNEKLDFSRNNTNSTRIYKKNDGYYLHNASDNSLFQLENEVLILLHLSQLGINIGEISTFLELIMTPEDVQMMVEQVKEAGIIK